MDKCAIIREKQPLTVGSGEAYIFQIEPVWTILKRHDSGIAPGHVPNERFVDYFSHRQLALSEGESAVSAAVRLSLVDRRLGLVVEGIAVSGLIHILK